jgi:hypothetical protein
MPLPAVFWLMFQCCRSVQGIQKLSASATRFTGSTPVPLGPLWDMTRSLRQPRRPHANQKQLRLMTAALGRGRSEPARKRGIRVQRCMNRNGATQH